MDEIEYNGRIYELRGEQNELLTYLTRDCAYALITNERRKILMDIRVNSSNLLSIYYA